MIKFYLAFSFILLLSFSLAYGQTARIEIDYENSTGFWNGTDTILTCTDVEIAFKFICEYECNFLPSHAFKIYTEDEADWSGLHGQSLCPGDFCENFNEIFVDYNITNDGPPVDTSSIAYLAITKDGWMTPDTIIPFSIKFNSGAIPGRHIIIDTTSYVGFDWGWFTIKGTCEEIISGRVAPEWNGPYEFVLLELPCMYDRGDVNCSSEIDISDITKLINFLYIDHDAPCCYYEADVDASGGEPDMSDITRLIDHLYLSHEPLEGMPGCEEPEPSGRMTGRTGCKSFEKSVTETPSDQDCIEYEYDGTGTLALKHVNAGFNCCPIMDNSVIIEGNTITIREVEIEGLCDCLCLFDLDYEIINLPPGTYTIRVEEPYLWEGDDPLEFPVDLEEAVTGSFCVSRTYYPWGY
ncbi:MAG: hypothetical protein JXA92_14315 [candidate division Zixibacteria bacterium]|nr:hypothetical protein [candidate division Zixibacteria bacterium]